MTGLVVNVVGTPAPQGSKKGFYNPHTGRVQMKESSAKVKPWRQDVVTSVENLRGDLAAGFINGVDQLPLGGPLEVEVTFYLPRPGYHFGTGKNKQRLKDSAPSYVEKKPDVDKLLRSTLDGLKEAGVYRDDAQVAVVHGVKKYADAATGARITITPLDAVPAAAGPETPAAGTATTPTSEQGVLL